MLAGSTSSGYERAVSGFLAGGCWPIIHRSAWKGRSQRFGCRTSKKLLPLPSSRRRSAKRSKYPVALGLTILLGRSRSASRPGMYSCCLSLSSWPTDTRALSIGVPRRRSSAYSLTNVADDEWPASICMACSSWEGAATLSEVWVLGLCQYISVSSFPKGRLYLCTRCYESETFAGAPPTLLTHLLTEVRRSQIRRTSPLRILRSSHRCPEDGIMLVMERGGPGDSSQSGSERRG